MLFVAVIERIQELFDGRIKTPEHYAQDPIEAAVLFCGRFAQMLTWAPILRTCRLGIAEAERLPEASSRLYEAFFSAAQSRLTSFLNERFRVENTSMTHIVEQALTNATQPWLTRALFGLKELRDEVPDETTISTDIKLAPIRALLNEFLIQNRLR